MFKEYLCLKKFVLAGKFYTSSFPFNPILKNMYLHSPLAPYLQTIHVLPPVKFYIGFSSNFCINVGYLSSRPCKFKLFLMLGLSADCQSENNFNKIIIPGILYILEIPRSYEKHF